MTALAREKMQIIERWTRHLFTLASGKKAWQGGLAALNTATGKVEPASSAAGLVVIGVFAESIDATTADKEVNVDLGLEIEVRWWANAGTGGATATDLGKIAFVVDDQTVGITEGPVVAGRIWAVDAKGVAVEKLQYYVAPPVVTP
jgi:hypothetical protein